ncbi:serine/threonine-protein phosphatase 6 regulatory subunit 3-like protein [Tanacetum coccineum]
MTPEIAPVVFPKKVVVAAAATLDCCCRCYIICILHKEENGSIGCDEILMNLMFTFIEPEHPYSALLDGYLSKVVVAKDGSPNELYSSNVPIAKKIDAHQDIIKKLVNLIGITSIMEWLEDTDVLEMIVDKFSSTDCPEVHANAAEALCAITRYAPPGLSAKISSLSFIRRLFCHALEDSRPKSVLVNSFSSTQGSVVSAKPETMEGMLESLGNLIKLLDALEKENALFTTYGTLQPPLRKNRLKAIFFALAFVSSVK